MRILIGTAEICGWVSLLQSEFNRMGHHCDTLIKSKNRLYPTCSYTYDASKFHLKFKSQNGYLNKFQDKINSLITDLYLKAFLLAARDKYEVIIYIWDTILPSFEDVLLFKKSGAKIVFLFAGSDVRSFSHFKSKYDVSHWEFPSYWTNENIDRKRKYVDVAERYSDLIYSVPDQSGLQTKPYYHLQIMVDLKRFTFLNNNRRVPNVLHLPSEPWKKGTDIIEKTINELISEGVKITFFSFRDIPNSHIPPLLRDMDVLVDEIILHGPGVLSFEAMASGCAVATRYLESSPDCFRPPVWNVNAGNLKVKLRQLFEDFELRQKLIAEGRKYVEERNDSGIVAANILFNLAEPLPPDYVC